MLIIKLYSFTVNTWLFAKSVKQGKLLLTSHLNKKGDKIDGTRLFVEVGKLKVLYDPQDLLYIDLNAKEMACELAVFVKCKFSFEIFVILKYEKYVLQLKGIGIGIELRNSSPKKKFWH